MQQYSPLFPPPPPDLQPTPPSTTPTQPFRDDQRDLEDQIEKSVEYEIAKNAYVDALRDIQNEHQEEVKRILQELHAHQEQHLAHIVDCAIRQAFAHVGLSCEPLPVDSGAKGVSLGIGAEVKDVAPQPDQTKPNQRARDNRHVHPTVAVAKEVPDAVAKEVPKENVLSRKNSKEVPVAVGQEFPTPDAQRLKLPKTSLEQNVTDVNNNLHAVVHLARAGSTEDLSTPVFIQKIEKVVSHPVFDYVIGIFIIANALVIAIQTELAAQDPKGKAPSSFRALDVMFTIIFSIELALKVIVERRRFIFGRNKGWNFFDTCVVTSALVEEWLKASTNTTAVRVLRIMRLVRVIRVIRTLRLFNDLRAMVRGIIRSILSLVWALVLLILICFVVGIFITQIVTSYRLDHGDDESLEQFGSMGPTMYALYKSITGGDDWSNFADPLFKISPIMGIFFCLYIAFAVFAVLNVLTGVFVDNAIKANQRDADTIIMEQTESRKKHLAQVKSVFKKADSDSSGHLSWPEFQQHLDNPYVQAYFRQLELDIEGPGAWSLFNLLDFDGNGSIDVEEFIFGCGQLKGQAKGLDLARIGHGQRQLSNKLIALTKEQHERLDSLLSVITSQFRHVCQKLDKLEGKIPTRSLLQGPLSPSDVGHELSLTDC